MKRWSTRQKLIAIVKHKKKTYNELSRELNRSEKTISNFLCKNGYKKCPNYTETEIYLLQHFPARQCAIFIPHKSLNAIKIKQSRLRKQSQSITTNHHKSQSITINHHKTYSYASV